MHIRPLHFSSLAVVVFAGCLAACGGTNTGTGTVPGGTALLGQSPNGTTPTTVPTTYPTTGANGTPTTAPTTVATTVPNGTSTTSPGGSATASPSPIALATTTANVAVGSLANVGVSLNDGGAIASVTSSNPAIAAIANAGNGLLSVVGNAAGTTTATVTDTLGHSQVLNVSVAPATAAPFNVTTGGLGLNILAGNIGVGSTILTASDPNHPGATFTATVTPPGIVTIAQLLNVFTVVSVTPGTAIITITENGTGNTQVVGLTVQ